MRAAVRMMPLTIMTAMMMMMMMIVQGVLNCVHRRNYRNNGGRNVSHPRKDAAITGYENGIVVRFRNRDRSIAIDHITRPTD